MLGVIRSKAIRTSLVLSLTISLAVFGSISQSGLALARPLSCNTTIPYLYYISSPTTISYNGNTVHLYSKIYGYHQNSPDGCVYSGTLFGEASFSSTGSISGELSSTLYYCNGGSQITRNYRYFTSLTGGSIDTAHENEGCGHAVAAIVLSGTTYYADTGSITPSP